MKEKKELLKKFCNKKDKQYKKRKKTLIFCLFTKCNIL